MDRSPTTAHEFPLIYIHTDKPPLADDPIRDATSGGLLVKLGVSEERQKPA